MYMEDDTMTPRDRISDDMLRRMLNDDNTEIRTPSRSGAPTPNCQGEVRRSWGLQDYPLASVYAPLQEFRKLHDRETALHKGTIFSELDLPFMGASVMKGGVRHG